MNQKDICLYEIGIKYYNYKNIVAICNISDMIRSDPDLQAHKKHGHYFDNLIVRIPWIECETSFLE